MNVVICCASHYMVPNALVALAADAPPDRVVILCGAAEPPTRNDLNNAVLPAERLKLVLEGRKAAKAPEVVVVRAPPFDPAVCRSLLIAELTRYGAPRRIVANVTGGTTPMRFAAAQAAEAVGAEVVETVCFQPGPNRVIPLTGTTGAPQPLASRDLLVDDYLRLHGFLSHNGPRTSWRAAEAAWRNRENVARLHAAWAGDAPAARGLLSTANALAHQNDRLKNPNRLRRQAITDSEKYRRLMTVAPSDALEARVCEDAAAAGLMTQDADGSFCFVSVDAVELMGGGWFEQHVYNLVRAALPSGIQAAPLLGLELDGDGLEWDSAAGAVTDSGDRSSRHEIDVGLFFDNQLHVLECKTGNLTRPGLVEPLNQEAINRLAFLKKNLVGPRGMVALVHPSFPPERDEGALIAKAASENIHLWRGAEGMTAMGDWLRKLTGSR